MGHKGTRSTSRRVNASRTASWFAVLCVGCDPSPANGAGGVGGRGGAEAAAAGSVTLRPSSTARHIQNGGVPGASNARPSSTTMLASACRARRTPRAVGSCRSLLAFEDEHGSTTGPGVGQRRIEQPDLRARPTKGSLISELGAALTPRMGAAMSPALRPQNTSAARCAPWLSG